VAHRTMTARSALLLFAGAWAASVVGLAASGLPAADPVVLAAIFGVALPGIALAVCRGFEAPPAELPIAGEAGLLASLVLLITIFLAVKGPLLLLVAPPGSDPRWQTTANALVKLGVFVALPLALYALLLGVGPRALALRWPPGESAAVRRRSWLAFAIVGAALVAIQLVLGRGARPLLDGSLAGRHWIVGFVLCFLWMSVEAGLVEEVFFRVILQSRLAALTNSRGAGLWLGALVFGLAHAPGLFLRGGGVIEGLGASPSPLVATAYAVATMGVASLVFGVLWMRTRNWLLVVALHGLTDALANTPGFMDVWGF